MEKNFTEKDVSFFEQKGISKDQFLNQINQFEKGFSFATLSSSAVLNKGIVDIELEKRSLIKDFEQSELSVMKFVPASGAATRMFKDLFEFKNQKGSENTSEAVDYFFSQLKSFAFYNELQKAFEKEERYSLEKALELKKHNAILDMLLSDQGMNYGKLPKGLLKFHKYDQFEKTPAEEHLTEGENYCLRQNKIKIHFTVSPEHKTAFQNHIDRSISKHKFEFDINFSTQKPSTDTIAVDLENNPFRIDDDKILFRPAGHGALLENLNELDSDIIFIKNIDNVVPDNLKQDTTDYKKALGGLLIKYQKSAFELLRKHDLGENIEEEGKSLLEKMGLKGSLTSDKIVNSLNRPIRVCGMVKNEGEPGGGPFWLVDDEGNESLQIVESAQVDFKDENQVKIFNSSTHFNPVDLVCGIRDYKGKKFNLMKYRDAEAGFISEKSKNGKKLKAMELPGLWNGSMAYWNTIFVEVPLSTFNPVKTVNDLLKESHR
ncbi:MAG: DUF4301 family protein [Ekhidna sp.]